MSETDNQSQSQSENLDENTIIQERRNKLNILRQANKAYPNNFKRHDYASKLQEKFSQLSKEELEQNKTKVVVAGRLMHKRLMGKASFIQIQDMSGKIQVYLKRDDLPEGIYEEFKSFDYGDIVGVSGYLFKTKTGELSVFADNIQLLTKSLRPMPEKFHGLQDQETKYRQRYLDLMTSDKTRNTFFVRSKLIQAIRGFLLKHDYQEVETPMMHPIPGGAAARPFKTHHNALDMPLFLRIAPELYLKRLVVGGIERVFEVNRNFRNEGLSTRHNPEFTMLEFYQAYADYNDLIALTETMFHELAMSVLGTNIVEYQGNKIDFSQKFLKQSVLDAIIEHNPKLDKAKMRDLDYLNQVCKNLEIPVKADYGWGKLQIEIFDKTVEHKLIQPTFITDYPLEISPLARKKDADPELTDRFELFIAGREIANGFSELNDPDDQAARFKEQLAQLEAGDLEAMHYDADYIKALEYGLPPTAGEGIGIDRLVMIFTDSPSIRDVILFPHMRAN